MVRLMIQKRSKEEGLDLVVWLMGAFWEMRFDVLNYSSSERSELVMNLCCYAAKLSLVVILSFYIS
jgi:hypothetical protein